MNAGLLYRQQSKSRVWFALGFSALIHCAAIAIAEIKRTETTTTGPGFSSPEFPTIEIEDPIAPDIHAPPPQPQETPTAIPPEDAFFPPDRVAPPPVRRPIQKAGRSASPPATRQSRGSVSSAKLLAVTAPRPEYPYEARRAKITGQGVAVMTVDPASGVVMAVEMATSTGNAALDQASLTAFRKWRFRPGTAATVRCPVTYTLTGAMF